MELIRGLHNLKQKHHGCVATVGNFDGVHLGHQRIISQVAKKALAFGLPSTVMLFEPQPIEYFTTHSAPPRIMRLRDKLENLSRFGVDRVVCVRFNEAFRTLSAEKFVKDVLIDGMGVRFLVVGDDFRFGSDRVGDFKFLQAAGRRYGFEVEHTETTEYQQERVSSTRIREALANSEFNLADQLLGHPFRISGRVVHGDKIGRTIGVPTANILLGRQCSPLKGIFAVEVDGIAESSMPGMASLGNRPTVGGEEERLEVHLLNFNGDIYGKRVHVRFIEKIRDEEKFNDLSDLKIAIENDIAKGKRIFNIK